MISHQTSQHYLSLWHSVLFAAILELGLDRTKDLIKTPVESIAETVKMDFKSKTRWADFESDDDS